MQNTSYRIGALQRALVILDTLAEMSGVTVAELAAFLQVPKGSVFRHLKVLEANGYVRQLPATKRYSLGPKLVYLGHVAKEQMGLGQAALPVMTALRDRFGETVHLGVLTGGEVVHIEVVPSMHPVKMASAVGDRTWAHVSGLGKVLLAWGGDGAVGLVLQERGLPPLTERSIVTREGLEEELEHVRRAGYAIDDEESARGLRCVAAPVRDASGDVVCGLSLSSPADRLLLADAHQAAPDVVASADAVSSALGWRGLSREGANPAEVERAHADH